jgi:REP element-mobilizing transposase RayT
LFARQITRPTLAAVQRTGISFKAFPECQFKSYKEKTKTLIFMKTQSSSPRRPNAYTQNYIHLVFAVKNRHALIERSWRDQLEKYITGVVQGGGHKLIAIACMPDHIHIFIGYNVNQLIPDLVGKVKTASNRWIKESGYCKSRFYWQNGYGCFSHSRSALERVTKYVLTQDRHHAKMTFRREYVNTLKKYDVEFLEERLFEFFDDSPNGGS